MTITFNGAPRDLLTYTAPSLKLTRQSNGVYTYQAHNLYLNSAAPADQAITVVSGATYSITITGTVSVTASGAATGTWTAGTNTFTAATTTLTLGSTSGAGTVHLRRTPSASTYIATTSAAKYDLPYEWDAAGTALGILVEESRTNLATYSSDFRNTADAGSARPWTYSNVSVTANAGVAPDGTTSADQINPSASPALYFQVSSPASAATWTFSLWIKSATGSNFSVAYYVNGSGSDPNPQTGTLGTATSEWTRVSVAVTTASSSATVNIAIGNYGAGWASGNNLLVWGAQLELGSFSTSPIETFGSTVTRAADSGLTILTSAYPHSATVNSGWIEYVPKNVAAEMVALRWDDGTADEVVSVGHSAAAAIGLTVVDGGAAQTAPLTSGTATANATERIGFSWKGNDFILSDNGATAATDTSGTLPTVTSLDLGPTLTGYIRRLLIVPVEKSAAEVEAMATP